MSKEGRLVRQDWRELFFLAGGEFLLCPSESTLCQSARNAARFPFGIILQTVRNFLEPSNCCKCDMHWYDSC